MLWVRFTLRYYRSDLHILIFYIYNDRPNCHDLISRNGIIKCNKNLTGKGFFYKYFVHSVLIVFSKVNISIDDEIFTYTIFFRTILFLIIISYQLLPTGQTYSKLLGMLLKYFYFTIKKELLNISAL